MRAVFELSIAWPAATKNVADELPVESPSPPRYPRKEALTNAVLAASVPLSPAVRVGTLMRPPVKSLIAVNVLFSATLTPPRIASAAPAVACVRKLLASHADTDARPRFCTATGCPFPSNARYELARSVLLGNALSDPPSVGEIVSEREAGVGDLLDNEGQPVEPTLDHLWPHRAWLEIEVGCVDATSR